MSGKEKKKYKTYTLRVNTKYPNNYIYWVNLAKVKQCLAAPSHDVKIHTEKQFNFWLNTNELHQRLLELFH